MSCLTIIDEEQRYFCFACNTTDVVFGPLMYVLEENGDILDFAEEFRESLGKDPRRFTNDELCAKWNEFIVDEDEDDD